MITVSTVFLRSTNHRAEAAGENEKAKMAPDTKMKFRIPYLILVLLLTMPFSAAQTTSLAGDWTGESICVGDNPSCHDEKIVYHISIDPTDPTKVKIAADKIVDG